ncbi:TetR/AcrR family transcriptional regulator [Hirschia litorea]|uniref:TetR/AcrR family transcriptional regulator n=1 Tax=Hirschia litorea TaxID=1199156 RepID=A0ABW2IN98_9PROT
MNAAAACFVERGFHGAGMAAIAKKAEMSPGHIYHYFSTKNDIIAAIVERESAAKVAFFKAFCDVEPENILQVLLDKVDEGVEKCADPFESILSREILAETQRNREIAQIVHRHHEDSLKVFVDILTSKLGVEDVESKVNCMKAMFSGIMIQVLVNPKLDRVALTAEVKRLIKFMLSGEKSTI